MVVRLSSVKSKTGKKNTKNAFFACFRPYVGQPDNHMGWATLMPFASIYPTDPMTNPVSFHRKVADIYLEYKLFSLGYLVTNSLQNSWNAF